MNYFISLILFCLPFVVAGQGFDPSILDTIKKKSGITHSDAVIIIQNDQVLYEDYFGKEEQPVYIASAGKSLVSLAIGRLLYLGLLDSLDQPVASIYPEWRQGQKKDVTIRMLLNHTSGLQNNPNASIELEPAPNYKVHNVIALALAAELTSIPGEVVNYNNKAVALLGGIVEKLSGKVFDQFFVDEFYKPMNIAQYDWIKDETGHPTTHGAFVIMPSDLIKFGQLILNKGMYEGKRLLSEEWIDVSLERSQKFTPIWGLLWWRLPKYEHRIIDEGVWASWVKAGVDAAFLASMVPMKGIVYTSKFEFYSDLEKHLGVDWNGVLNNTLPPSVQSSKRLYSDEIVAYYADGFRGNYLVIIPDKNIIALRCVDPEGFNYQTDFFSEFVHLIARLGK